MKKVEKKIKIALKKIIKIHSLLIIKVLLLYHIKYKFARAFSTGK